MRPESLVLRHVGRRVAELRTARGWTQDQFAERAKLSPGYVRQVEGGHENLTLVTLVKLATVLGVDAADLFTVPVSGEVRKGRPRKRATPDVPKESDAPAKVTAPEAPVGEASAADEAPPTRPRS